MPLLYPLSLLVAGAARVRGALYEAGLFKQHRLPCPVISVGNLTWGGEGKTPLVLHIASLIRHFGMTGALLSRGYGRIHPDRVNILAPGEGGSSSWENIGDEPAIIRRHRPDLWIGLSRDRYRAACSILERTSSVAFLLDDGFQHRKLHRDLDLLIVDSSKNPEHNRVFPAGSLREPPSSLRRAHAVVLNVGPSDAHRCPTEQFIRKVHPEIPIFHCRQEIDAEIPLDDWQSGREAAVTAAHVSSAFLVAAIGNPARFERDVIARGIRVTGARCFRDHFRPSEDDWHSCTEAARKAGSEVIITTEKDAVKIVHTPAYPILVARQATRMLETREFTSLIMKTIGVSGETH